VIGVCITVAMDSIRGCLHGSCNSRIRISCDCPVRCTAFWRGTRLTIPFSVRPASSGGRNRVAIPGPG
jgi:hypothetical protein